MSAVVLQIENLSKTYRLGKINSGTLRHDLESFWSRLRKKEDPNTPLLHDSGQQGIHIHKGYVQSLQNVSLQIRKGEIWGIVGKNGAGKSTLCKIISRITAPSEGCVRIRGNTVSLLEVGIGLHPELTGRENIFLSGAILGMKKTEILEKLGMILNFSEIGKHIDTPAKRYSSGMSVRLAFSVAIHLDAQIILLDEIFAVGDMRFQEKCFQKIQELAKHGAAVLCVSHTLSLIERLCTKAVCMHQGRVLKIGKVAEVLDYYKGMKM